MEKSTLPLSIVNHLFDVGANYGDVQGCLTSFVEKTKASWAEGADIVMFPEYSWLNIAQYRDVTFDLREFAEFFWAEVYPKLVSELESVTDKMAVLGSVPCVENGQLLNRAIIFCEGKFTFQDKLCLTPWEDMMDAGDSAKIVTYKGYRCATLICLDSEIPALGERLKKENIDILLVPSAVADILGIERIGRCSSARAVELCAYVFTCSLIGGQDDDFIGANVGPASMYLPSLEEFKHMPRMVQSETFTSGEHQVRYDVDMALLKEAKEFRLQTNPAHVNPRIDLK